MCSFLLQVYHGITLLNVNLLDHFSLGVVVRNILLFKH